MPLGFAMLLCALALSIFGIASPIIKPLRIPLWALIVMLVAMFGLGLAGMTNVSPEFSFQSALIVPVIFAVVLFARMSWMRQRLIALLCALAAGFAAFAVKRLLLDNLDFPEPGLLLGVVIALVSVILGQHRRVRLFAGSVGVVFMALFAMLSDLVSGGYGVMRLGEGLQFDAAVAALILTILFAGVATLLRRRSLGIHDELAPRTFMEKKK